MLKGTTWKIRNWPWESKLLKINLLLKFLLFQNSYSTIQTVIFREKKNKHVCITNRF